MIVNGITGITRWRCAIGIERRRDQRLPLPIPLFLRGQDSKGKEFFDLSLALNVSAGGALVATREALPRSLKITLELPCAPLPSPFYSLQMKGGLHGRVIRSTNKDSYFLCAVRFARPLPVV
jgi:hypothetical protein